MNNNITNSLLLLVLSLFGSMSHAMKMPGHDTKTVDCVPVAISCASTVTSAFAPDGSLWRLWSVNNSLYYDKSEDMGKSFTAAKRVAIAAEKISSRGENRPKIAIDQFNAIYVSWAHPLQKRFSASIRYTY
jgi:hypothetical protein